MKIQGDSELPSKEGFRPDMEPCSLVRRFAAHLIASAQGHPIVDVACGQGRNAVFLSRQGCEVICIDRDLSGLRKLIENSHEPAALKLKLYEVDLERDPWPLDPNSVGGIVNTQYLLRSLFALFKETVILGGLLLVETIPAHGGNYISLPKSGELRRMLEDGFMFEYYAERKAGPGAYDAATVKLLARKV